MTGLMFPKQPVKKKRRKHHASIIPGNQKGICYLCKKTGHTEEHHIFFGTAERRLSEEYGLKVYLCPECHRNGKYSAHRSKETADYLHRIGQQAYERSWGSREQFNEEFKINYLPGDGDEVYGTFRRENELYICKGKIISTTDMGINVRYTEFYELYRIEDIGKILFFTEQEAEQKIRQIMEVIKDGIQKS